MRIMAHDYFGDVILIVRSVDHPAPQGFVEVSPLKINDWHRYFATEVFLFSFHMVE